MIQNYIVYHSKVIIYDEFLTNCKSTHVYTTMYLWSQPVVIEEQELKRTRKYVKTNQDNKVSYALLSKLEKKFSINNRRYLGNKYKLNQFIKSIILKECGEFESFADLFAGTGSVASIFQNKHLIVNDILYSNYVCHQTWFGTEKYSLQKAFPFGGV